MECVTHPGNEAIGVCTNCGRAICENCRLEVEGKLLCRNCESQDTGLEKLAGTPKSASTNAITAFVLSMVGISCCITAIPGLILGLVELKKIKRGEAPQEGRGFALAAAIVGGILTGLTILFVVAYIIIIAVGMTTNNYYNY